MQPNDTLATRREVAVLQFKASVRRILGRFASPERVEDVLHNGMKRFLDPKNEAQLGICVFQEAAAERMRARREEGRLCSLDAPVGSREEVQIGLLDVLKANAAELETAIFGREILEKVASILDDLLCEQLLVAKLAQEVLSIFGILIVESAKNFSEALEQHWQRGGDISRTEAYRLRMEVLSRLKPLVCQRTPDAPQQTRLVEPDRGEFTQSRVPQITTTLSVSHQKVNGTTNKYNDKEATALAGLINRVANSRRRR